MPPQDPVQGLSPSALLSPLPVLAEGDFFGIIYFSFVPLIFPVFRHSNLLRISIAGIS